MTYITHFSVHFNRQENNVPFKGGEMHWLGLALVAVAFATLKVASSPSLSKALIKIG